MHSYFIPAILAFLILSLAACAPFQLQHEKAAICNELNSRIIFNGGTSIDRQADIENSEKELIERSYQRQQCDQN